MSASRAAVFTEQSPGVEVQLDGAWRPGVILGWRHDARGACEVRVRVTVGDAAHETWTDLADLRLPEPGVSAPAVPRSEAPVLAASPTVSWSRAAARERLVADIVASPRLPDGAVGASGAETPRRRRRHGVDVTAEQPAVRADVTGRHRAPAARGRHRAADEETRTDAETAATAPPRAEVDCLTRPLRLGDRLPRPRLVRPDGSVRA
ncbi:hypothetical protein SAMN06893097_108235 [Geodermatophilus sabuli]|uniref:Uncharacterized protein n=2 Tax=Geodermatophilus sabuli TaxID=1564158 RepID=A0A285EFH3_9ACTN|nr:hypothetical protein SAMN06893097_108235 [Geodermatophilus sabuli]